MHVMSTWVDIFTLFLWPNHMNNSERIEYPISKWERKAKSSTAMRCFFMQIIKDDWRTVGPQHMLKHTAHWFHSHDSSGEPALWLCPIFDDDFWHRLAAFFWTKSDSSIPIVVEGQPPIVEWMWMVLQPLSCWPLPQSIPFDVCLMHAQSAIRVSICVAIWAKCPQSHTLFPPSIPLTQTDLFG